MRSFSYAQERKLLIGTFWTEIGGKTFL